LDNPFNDQCTNIYHQNYVPNLTIKYLLVRHFMKKGAENAPTAAPRVKIPIRKPLTVEFWVYCPQNKIKVLLESVDK
jgi:hypothetical protein